MPPLASRRRMVVDLHEPARHARPRHMLIVFRGVSRGRRGTPPATGRGRRAEQGSSQRSADGRPVPTWPPWCRPEEPNGSKNGARTGPAPWRTGAGGQRPARRGVATRREALPTWPRIAGSGACGADQNGGPSTRSLQPRQHRDRGAFSAVPQSLSKRDQHEAKQSLRRSSASRPRPLPRRCGARIIPNGSSTASGGRSPAGQDWRAAGRSAELALFRRGHTAPSPAACPSSPPTRTHPRGCSPRAAPRHDVDVRTRRRLASAASSSSSRDHMIGRYARLPARGRVAGVPETTCPART